VGQRGAGQMRSPWDFVFAIAERTRQGERERFSSQRGNTTSQRHIAHATKILPLSRRGLQLGLEEEDEPL